MSPSSGLALVLSLVATLVAVASALLPPLLDKTFPKSDLEIVDVEPKPTGVVFAVRNSGNRDGLLSRAAFHLHREQGRECSGEPREASVDDLRDGTGGFPLFPPDRRASRVVPADGIVEIEFELRDTEAVERYGQLAALGTACEVVLHVEARLREFSGEKNRRVWSLDANQTIGSMDP